MMSSHRRRHHHGQPASGRFFGPGELRLALLALLADGPGHGYDLMTRLEARFDGAYQASAGAIYPTLQQLEDEGLVSLEQVNGRKVFHLTVAGQSEVDNRGNEIAEIWSRAAWRGEWGVLREPDAAEIVKPALRLMKTAVKAIVKSHRDPAVVERIRTLFEETRRQIELLGRSHR
jgi:DNA-binding PadR family transcriptional regulator